MIDVIIPVYNCERFISKAIESILAQTLLPNQIIIINDGSTDNTQSIIEGLAKNSKIKITIIKQSNHGLSNARNKGILHSSAEFVAFLDADDEWYPNKLEKQLGVFKESELVNLGAVYCQYAIIDSDSNLTRYFALSFRRDIRGYVFDKIIRENLIISSASGILIKREVFDRVGYFDENLKACEDWDMWLRIAREYYFDYSEATLVKIRKHSRNMQKNDWLMLKNHLIFFKKWIVLNKKVEWLWVKYTVSKLFYIFIKR